MPNASSLLPDEFVAAATAMAGLELSLHPFAVLISTFNFCLLLNTSLLHPNLKGILLAQSVSIAVPELLRLAYVSLKFTSGNIFYGGAQVLTSVALFFITFRNMLVHVLLAERVLATVLFRKYQYANFRGPLISISWILALSLLSFQITFSQAGYPGRASILTLSIYSGVFVLGIVEIVAMALIYARNIRRYLGDQGLTLDEKFQLSENIRTAKQLAASFVLNAANASLNIASLFLIYFCLSTQPLAISLLLSVGTTFNCVTNVLIEFTVITHHPVLRRNAVKCLKFVFECKKRRTQVQDTTVTRTQQRNMLGKEIRDIHGQNLVSSAEQEDHFRMLRDHWG